MPGARALFAGFLACALSSCAPVAGPRGARTPGASSALIEAASAIPDRAEYGTDPTPDGIRGGALAEGLAAKVRDHFSKLELSSDGRMADIATLMTARTQLDGKPPDAMALDAITREAGFAGPVPTVFVAPRTGDSWERLDDFLALNPGNMRFTRLGVVVMDLGGAVVGAVALGASNVALEPVKRRVEPSERVRIKGTLAGGYAKSEVAWTRPDGSTVRTRAGDTTVEFETPALERGLHRIEVLAVGPSGLEVLANMPVACGVELPSSNERSAPVDESNPEAAMLELVNRDRQRSGAKPLTTDSSLEETARAHSQDMVDGHFFGHKSPTTGVVDDRLRARGLRLGLFGENVAKGPSMTEAHALLLASPAHRQNVVNSRFTHVGIGVVQERAGDPPLFAVTEVFAGFPAPISDSNAAERSTLAALNQIRAKAAVAALPMSRALQTAAREIATQVAASATASPVDVAKPIIARRLPGTGHRRPLLLVGFSLDPVELTHDERLKAPRLRAAGVAVAQTPSSAAPKANVIVFLLAE
jgi:uncharacterized protein YkwD